MKSTACWSLPCVVLAVVAMIGTHLSSSNIDSLTEAGVAIVASPDAAPELMRLPPDALLHASRLVPNPTMAEPRSVIRPVSHLAALLPLQPGDDEPASGARDGESESGVQTSPQPATQQPPPTPPRPVPKFEGATLNYKNINGTSHTVGLNDNDELRIRPRDSITITGKLPPAVAAIKDVVVIVEIGGTQRTAVPAGGSFAVEVPAIAQGPHVVRVSAVTNGTLPTLQAGPLQFQLRVRTTPLRVLDVDAGSLSFSTHPYPIQVRFDTSEIEVPVPANAFELRQLTDSGQPGATVTIERVTQIANSASVELFINQAIPAGLYTLKISGGESGLKDRYGNLLLGNDTAQVNFIERILKPIGAETPSVRAGITGPTGPYIEYPEFTKPRIVPDGFNPHDKVESRVARLYFYRDAHRVAQIINRKLRSYNRAGVDMQRQLADNARTVADQRTDARQVAERNAMILAQKTREKEHELRAAEQSLSSSIQELNRYRPSASPDGTLPHPANDPMLRQLAGLTDSLANRADNLRAEVGALRDQEVAANEQAIQIEASEKRARESQFRLEVAAAHADPDSYAPGVPGSNDPVEQVSVSVIGEGLIHLRGPLKGINIIRTMIDQIDQPVGQVRVAVHTVQINGEKQSRMEDVAKIIQMYIDHSRFLTAQTSEMLRKSVVQVASRKAETARMLYPGDTQDDRDRRYLDSFFGKDFIDELATMDSEFLRTGNKILSLHSMDTTSLSSALNLIALAKNSTRIEIFGQFDQLLQGELPMAEAAYIQASMTACKEKHSCRHPPKFYPMAQNAAFQSLRGFFDMQIGHDDTMTPLQREFIRLAQIFKGRLITELEYKQRVRERAIIEERLGDRLQELQDARNKEKDAQGQLQEMQQERLKARDSLTSSFVRTLNELQLADRNVQDLFGQLLEFKGLRDEIQLKENRETVEEFRASRERSTDSFVLLGTQLEHIPYKIIKDAQDTLRVSTSNDEHVKLLFVDAIARQRRMLDRLSQFTYLETAPNLNQARIQLQQLEDYSRSLAQREGVEPIEYDVVRMAADLLDNIGFIHVELQKREADFSQASRSLLAAIGRDDADMSRAYKSWAALYREITDFVRGNPREAEIRELLGRVDQAFTGLLELDVRYQSARGIAQSARRPLDHKKFLDMLIDDLEEKYIELLDGTRAHTANVDNYLKRVTTALDDDFNVQFYNPAFRSIRETGSSWDVQFGQTETTSILANNRELGKVDPSATMEFDLPARGIVIAEALNGAKALMDDVGALANDPTFLAMARSQMGSPADMAPGSSGGQGVVRNVIPGLQTSTAERAMAHNAGQRPQLGSNLENLIPDPAIYKFETGTGYEIRPVIQPDGQAVVFHFHYMYTTNVREPVRADEKHLGRVKRHFIDTDVQLSNFELREVSRYTVALKAARTSRGVPLLEDIPGLGVLFRPLPSQQSSLQQNIILSQATIFPTLFDLMGLRWAPAAVDLDPLRVTNREFVVRGRNRALENRVYDYSSAQVDEFLRIPEATRRSDLYRTQESLPGMHPNGYQGPGLDLRDSHLQEGYQPQRAYPEDQYIPGASKEGSPLLPGRRRDLPSGAYIEQYPLEEVAPGYPDPQPY